MFITTSAAAAVLDVEPKYLDNILSREGKQLIQQGKSSKQGRRRRIDSALLVPFAIAITLQRELGVPIARGLEIGAKFLDPHSSSIALGQLGALSFDLSALRSHLSSVLADVLEQTAVPKRGRPARAAE